MHLFNAVDLLFSVKVASAIFRGCSLMPAKERRASAMTLWEEAQLGFATLQCTHDFQNKHGKHRYPVTFGISNEL